MDGSIVFARWRQCAPQSPLNTCFLGPTSPYAKRHLDQFSRFCTAHGRRSLYFTMGHPFSPQNCHHGWDISTPPSNTWFLGPTRLRIPNSISIVIAIFAQLMAECPYSLQWVATFPLKIAPSHGKIWTPVQYVVPWATGIHNPNGILIDSAVFAGLTIVTDRRTDHATSVTTAASTCALLQRGLKNLSGMTAEIYVHFYHYIQ